jgi:hypothetical protein
MTVGGGGARNGGVEPRRWAGCSPLVVIDRIAFCYGSRQYLNPVDIYLSMYYNVGARANTYFTLRRGLGRIVMGQVKEV